MLLQINDSRIVLNLIDSLLNCLAQRILQLEKAGGFACSLHLQHLFKVKSGSFSILIICLVKSVNALIHLSCLGSLSKLLQQIIDCIENCRAGLNLWLRLLLLWNSVGLGCGVLADS